jgi:dynein heavy chain
VEKWLQELESSMKRTLEKILSRAIVSYSKVSQEDWIFSCPAQVVLAANQIIFTQAVTNKFVQNQDISELKAMKGRTIEFLNDLTKLVRGELQPLQRLTTTALLVQSVHNRDVLGKLIQTKISQVHDFEWKSQLRYYWEDQTCVVRLLDGSFRYGCSVKMTDVGSYGYEYLGNTTRLVITPLTERVRRTLASALHFNLGGAASGPAGTGKTETVKDFAKAVAKQVDL